MRRYLTAAALFAAAAVAALTATASVPDGQDVRADSVWGVAPAPAPEPAPDTLAKPLDSVWG